MAIFNSYVSLPEEVWSSYPLTTGFVTGFLQERGPRRMFVGYLLGRGFAWSAGKWIALTAGKWIALTAGKWIAWNAEK